jgi:hypothetical protein
MVSAIAGSSGRHGRNAQRRQQGCHARDGEQCRQRKQRISLVMSFRLL